MLNGIADDKLDIGPKCLQFLEDHGKRMREALIAMGEEDGTEKEEEEEPIKTYSNEPVTHVNPESKRSEKGEDKEMREEEVSNTAMDEID